jgi:hypothetical protein
VVQGHLGAFAASQLTTTAHAALGVAVLLDGVDNIESIIEIVEASDVRLLQAWDSFKVGLPDVVLTGR